MAKNKLDENEELYSQDTPVYDPFLDPAGEVDEQLLDQDFNNSENAFPSVSEDNATLSMEDSMPISPVSNVSPASEIKSDPSSQPNDLMSRREQLLAQYKSLKPNDIYNDDELKQAQEDRRNQLMIASVGEAGAGISKAVAGRYGADLGDVSKPYDNMRKMAELPVSNIKERMSAQDEKRKALMDEIKSSDEVTKRDPSSRVSILMRKLATKRGLEVPEDANAADLENILSKIEKPGSIGKRFQTKAAYNPKTGQVELMNFDTQTGEMMPMNGAIAGFAPRTIKDPHTEEYSSFVPGINKITGQLTGPKTNKVKNEQTGKEEFTQGNLTAKQDKDLKRTQEQFLKDADDDRSAVNAAISVKTMLAAGKQMNGDILRAIQNQLARATGEKGAMTEQDVAPFGGKQAIMDRVARFASYNTVGEMPNADREFLSKVSDVLTQKSNDNIARRSNFFAENLQRDWSTDQNTENISKENVQKMLGVQSAQMSDANSDKVRVKNKKGQIGFIPKANLKKALENGYEEVK